MTSIPPHPTPRPTERSPESPFSGQILEDVLSRLRDPAVAADAEDRIFFWNDAAARLYGRAAQEVMGRTIKDVLRPRWLRAGDEHEAQDALHRAGSWRGELVHVKKTGEQVFVDVSLLRLLDPRARPAGALSLIRDATGLRSAHIALKANEARLRLLTSQLPAVMWTTDPDLRFTSSMGAGLAPLGLKPNQIVGMSLYDYFQTRDPKFIPIAMHHRCLQGKMAGYEFQWTGRTFQSNLEPLYDPEGTVLGVIGVAIDVTEVKRAETSLRESEERWRSLGANAPNYILTVDRNGRILFLNRTAPGFTMDQVVGRTVYELSNPAHHPGMRKAMASVFRTGRPVVFENAGAGPNGATAWYRNHAGPITQDGKIKCLIVVSTDITDHKRAEEDLKASLDQLRGLAARLQTVREEERKRISLEIHDQLGQELTSLKLDLSWLKGRLPLRGPGAGAMQERLQSMMKSFDTAIRTVRRISTELRPAILDSLGLKAAIEWQAKEFQTRTGIQVRLTLPSADIGLDPEPSTAFFRIFQEILTNAARHSRATRLDILLQRKDGRLLLEVDDNGKGLSAKALTDPKSLGLLGMRERALLFGGEVSIHGSRAKGTSVAVRMPLPRRRRKTR